MLPPGRVLRLILSLERLHLRLCLPAGVPRRLHLGEGNCYFFLYLLGSGDFQHSNCNSGEKCARACSALSTPPFAAHESARPALLFLHLREGRKLAEECAAEEMFTNFTWDESLKMDRVTLGRPRWKPHNGVIFL